VETLKKFCTKHVTERCKGERQAYAAQGMFFDHKVGHCWFICLELNIPLFCTYYLDLVLKFFIYPAITLKLMFCRYLYIYSVPSFPRMGRTFESWLCLTKRLNILPLHFQILHISDADVLETKMMGSTPIIVVLVGPTVLCWFFVSNMFLGLYFALISHIYFSSKHSRYTVFEIEKDKS
jgi:hypothetical protein